jgi:hypothetical protein
MLDLTIDPRSVKVTIQVTRIDQGTERSQCDITANVIDEKTQGRVLTEKWVIKNGEERCLTITFSSAHDGRNDRGDIRG